MPCKHWTTSDERNVLGYRENDAMPHQVYVDIGDNVKTDLIFRFIDSESATGLWMYRSGRGDDPFQFLFSDANTAFDFKLRFG